MTELIKKYQGKWIAKENGITIELTFENEQMYFKKLGEDILEEFQSSTEHFYCNPLYCFTACSPVLFIRESDKNDDTMRFGILNGTINFLDTNDIKWEREFFKS